MKKIYFDCFAGTSGDMIIGAFLDAGFDFNLLKNELTKLNLPRYELSVSKCQKKNISASKFSVHTSGIEHARSFSDIARIIDQSGLHPVIKKNSLAVFRIIAEAESKIHNTTIESVHFHEIGAVDSIIDICGAAVCFHHWDVTDATSSAVNTGSGMVDTGHGLMPVPAPATAEILRGVPLYSGGADGELATPTGAALIKHFCSGFSQLPSMTTDMVGYGAGTKDFSFPNVLRIFVSDIIGARPITDEVIEIETAIDDMNPEIYSYLFEKLLSEGALDVTATPALMKKNRPGNILKILTAKETSEKIINLIFAETTTSGLRINTVKRRILERELVSVDTQYGPVRVKIHRINGKAATVSPEYEDCRATASRHGVPLKKIYTEAAARAYSLF